MTAVPHEPRRPPARAVTRAALPILLPAAILAALLSLAEFLGRAHRLPITVAAPSQIIGAFLTSGDDLFYHMGPTVLSAFLGFLFALLLALLLGATAQFFRHTEKPILGFGILVDSMPLIAVSPILMSWTGNGFGARIAIATIGSFFPLLVGTMRGFRAIDRHAAELFHVLSANRQQRLTKLALPCALPYLFAAGKIAAPLALLGALIAEWVGADRGLGIMMVYALFSFNVPLTWLTIVAVCLLAVAAYGLIALLERLVVGARGVDIGTLP